MHALHQRLRELDWDTFQRLIGQLLAARFPNQTIRPVDGPGGDGGLDIYEGVLDGRPTIWQCKQFPNGLGTRQRAKVKESLKTALKNYRPRNWVLVLPIDLDDKQHLWFDKLKRAHAGKVALGLFQGSDIVRELIYRRTLRDAFFPGAVLDTVTVRRATAGMQDLDQVKLEQQTDTNIAELIARLEEADARFHFRLSYAPNAGPESLTESGVGRPIASVLREGRRLDVLPRDLEALKLDPPSFRLGVRESGHEKIQRSMRTGERVTLEPAEVVSFSSTFDFLLPARSLKGMQVTLSTAGPLAQRRPKLKVRFQSANDSVEFSYVEFRFIRAGSEEMEVESISPPLGFTLNFVIPLVAGKEAEFGFTRKFGGAELKVVEKAVRVLVALQEGATITLHDLEGDLPLGSMQAKTDLSDNWRSYRDLIADAMLVANRFGLNLRVPERVTTTDLAAVHFYKSLIAQEPLPIDGFNATLVKRSSPEIEATIRNARLLEAFATLPNLPGKLPLFGTTIQTGSVTLIASKATIRDKAKFWRRFASAKEGDVVPIAIAAETIRGFLGPSEHEGLFIRPDPSEQDVKSE
jgi:hypothetical protein